MIKFFRKYNKRILVLVTIFLMIVFVGGSALSSLMAPNPTSQQIAEAFGKPINQGDFNAVKGQTDILTRLGYPWNYPWGLGGRLEPLEVMDYLLLLRETDERGLRPNLEQARIQLAGLTVDLNEFSLKNRVSTDQIEAAVANYRRVVQLWGVARASVLPSELEIRQAVRDQYEKVNANIVEIKSAPLIDHQAEISEEVLQAHFEKYQEQTAGEDPLEFGYLIPDRVQVEYLVINTGSIELTQAVTEKQAEDYWREHQAEFRRPEESEPDDAGFGEGEVELEGPEPPPTEPQSPYYESFAEAAEDVFEHLRKQQQLEQARELAGLIWGALREPWYNQPEDEAGFPQPPAVAIDPDHYQKTVEQLKDRIEHPECIEFGRTGLFTAAEVSDQERIGNTREDTQSNIPGRRFGQNTHLVQGLIESARANDGTATRVLALHQTASSPLIDSDNNLYLYRVIGVETRRPPASIDEVRDAVLADVRALQAFEAAKAHAEEIKASMGEDGLKAAWEAYDGLVADRKAECGSFFEANPFPRLNPEIIPGFRFPVIVSDKAGARDEEGKLRHQITREEFVEQVYELLDIEGESGVGMIEVPAMDRAFVVQLTGVDHVTAADYKAQKLAIRGQVIQGRLESLLREWFLADRIRARCGFQAGP